MEDLSGTCSHCRGPADCECPNGDARCRSGSCECPPSCLCRASGGDAWPGQPTPQAKPRLATPVGCLLPFFAPWILWLVWLALLPLILLTDDPPVWVWIIWAVPIVWAFLPIPKPGQQGIVAEGSGPPAPPWYAGCWLWPTMVVLVLSIVTVVIVVLTSDGGDGGDGQSIEATPSTSEAREDDVATTEVRTDEATTTVADSDDEPEDVVSSTAATTEAPVIEPVPTSAPETTTTTTVAPTTTIAPTTTVAPTVPAVPLPPDAQAIVDTNCAVDENGEILVELSFVDADAAITTGPAEDATPPLATNPPPGIEIDYVGVATGTCPARSVLVSVRVTESVENVQVALALDFPDDVAGDAGYAADPDATDPIGLTAGWDQLFPYGNDGLLQFDDQFSTIDTGATATAEGNLVTFVVPVADDVEMLTYLVQTFFRDGTTADDPIAWSAATGEIDLAP